MSLPLNQIVCGDCIEVMQTFPDESIDMIFVDPPYFQNTIRKKYKRRGKGNLNINFGEWNNFDTERTYLDWCLNWLKECGRVLKNDSSLYICCIADFVSYFRKFLMELGFSYATTIVWHRTNPAPRYIMKAMYISSTELICFATKGRPTFNFLNFSEMLDYIETGLVSGKERTKHPTQKPEKMLDRFIQVSTNENQLILDPMCGSGTTCVVAEKLGRRWIGIDINPEYVEMAKKRLMRECSQKLTKFVGVVE